MESKLDLAPVLALAQADDVVGARDLLVSLLEKQPDALGFYNLGILEKLLGQHLSALKAFEASSELAPEQAQVWNEIGLIYDEMGKLAAAEPYYKKALELDPDFAGAWNNWGVLAFLKKHFPEARERFEKAVSLDPDSANAWFNLRDTLTELGDTAGAARAQARLDELEAAFAH